MPLQDLLLGTPRLRRDVSVQAQELERDVAQLKYATVQLRRSAKASATSPIALLSMAGVGFLIGKMAGNSSKPEHSARHHLRSLSTRVLNATHSLGFQIMLPIAIEWLHTKLNKHQHPDAASAEEPTTRPH